MGFGHTSQPPGAQPSTSTSQPNWGLDAMSEAAVSNATEHGSGWHDFLDLLCQLDSAAGLDPRSWYQAMTICPDCQVMISRRHMPFHHGTAYCGGVQQDLE